MIDYATITFSYDADGQFIFLLTVWITEMRTHNILGMDFCQKQVSGIHFNLPGIEKKNPPKSICHGSFHQNKSYPRFSQILTNRTPYTMCIDAESARCWKYSPADTHTHSPPGSTWSKNMCLWIDIMTISREIHGATNSKTKQLRTIWRGRLSPISYWTSSYSSGYTFTETSQ